MTSDAMTPEQAAARLTIWLSETPDYAGDDPRANHYRKNREATNALATLSGDPS